MEKRLDLNVSRVLRLRKKILEDFDVAALFSNALEGPYFDALVRALARLLPTGIRQSTVRDSVLGLLGEELTPALLGETAWRLAGNTHTLRRHVAVHPWRRQEEPEWAPVQFLGAKRQHSPGRPARILYDLRVLAGSPCPMIIQRAWKPEVLRFLARRFGFSDASGSRPYRNYREFVQLRCVVMFEPRMSQGKPGFYHLEVEPADLKHNRRILALRNRQGFRCPENYLHHCHLCEIGYEHCPAGTHLRTYYEDLCPKCKKTAPFDPARVGLDICVNCQDRG